MRMKKKISFFPLSDRMFLNPQLFMSDNGKEVLNTEEEFNIGRMGLFLRGIGEIIWLKERGD